MIQKTGNKYSEILKKVAQFGPILDTREAIGALTYAIQHIKHRDYQQALKAIDKAQTFLQELMMPEENKNAIPLTDNPEGF